MRWQDMRQSDQVEDRRGMGRIPGGGFTIGGCGLLAILGLALLTGQNPLQLFQVLEEQQAQVQPAPQMPQPGQPQGQRDELSQFAASVLGSTEDVWGQVFAGSQKRYQKPTLVLFTQAVESACGFASAASGPFYCPADGKVYVDLAFFDELDRRFGASGDFAQAYVIAHEVGHHVQNLLGISEQVQVAQQRSRSQEEANEYSVRLELQADCLAGVWAAHLDQQKRILEPGDIEEGMNAAAAVGDDRIQKSMTGYVQPESWTHGSSQQRVTWFRRGLQSGDPNTCDTFKG